MNVKVVLLPDGEDPDSYAQNNNASDFIDFIDRNQVDFIRFKIQLLLDEIGNDPIKRAGLIQDVVNSVSLIPDTIVRSVYAKECAKLLEIDEKVVLAEIQKILRAKKEKELIRKTNVDSATASINYEVTPKHETNPAYRQEPAVRDVMQNGVVVPMVTLDKEELNVLYYVVRHGDEVLFDEGDGEYQTVAQFVIASLLDLEEEGQSIFRNPLHQKMLDDARGFDAQNRVNSSRYFTNHIDPQISAIAADLMTDRYVLSRMHTKHEEFVGDPKVNPREYEEYLVQKEKERKETLAREIFTVIHEYKAAVICDKERNVDQQIREAQEANDTVRMIELIKKKQAILNAKKLLSQVIGGRVVLGRR
jgi:DNA primase